MGRGGRRSRRSGEPSGRQPSASLPPLVRRGMRADFEDDRALTRRRFIDALIGIAIAALSVAAILPLLRLRKASPASPAGEGRARAGSVSELAVRRWAILLLGAEPVICLQVGPGQYRAFSAVCTHQQCTVQFDQASDRIWCACHNGWYDLEGRNIGGPPPRPLSPLKVVREGDEIYVSRD